MRVLDLFCGMGAWSVGFHREGFDCLGIDIVDVGYPYDFIHQDIHDFDGSDYSRIDVVVASPPCTEFSRLKSLYGHGSNRKAPADPEKGMELVREAKRIIDEASPRFWLIENVGGAVSHFKPFLGDPKFVRRPFYLWGKFPQFLLEERDYRKPGMQHYDKKGPGHVKFNPMISWLRARIPIPLSIELAHACKQALNNGNTD